MTLFSEETDGEDITPYQGRVRREMYGLKRQDDLQEKDRLQIEERLQVEQEKKKIWGRTINILFLLFSFAAIMAFAFYVNRHIHIKALYID